MRRRTTRSSAMMDRMRALGLAITAVALAALAVAAAALAAGCNPGDFSDLADQTWVHPTEAPDNLNSDDYGAAVAFAGTSGSGASIAVAARAPAGIVLLDYDGGGSLDRRFRILSDEVPGVLSLPERPAVATDPDAFSDSAGNVAVAATDGSVPFAVLFTASSFEFPEAIAFGDSGGAPAALAFGRTDAGNAGDTDLVALVGDQLWLAQDYAGGAAPVACTVSGARNLVIADVAAGDGAEILLTTANGAALVRGSDVAAATCAPTEVEIGDGESDFGIALAVGDFDGSGEEDVAIGAPAGNAVYVIENGDVGSPLLIDGPGGSSAFGEALAAGDFDGDGTDELVVGDSGFSAEVSGGGAAHILGGGSLDTLATLFDADPEEDQRFGRSVAVARWSGDDDILVIGASEEVFTYFRQPISGDQDVRR